MVTSAGNLRAAGEIRLLREVSRRPPSRGGYISLLEVRRAVGRRGIKEYRAPEALALIAADREHVPLVCPSCGTRSIVRAPRRRGSRGGAAPLAPERVTLTCQSCGRHASYIERGPTAPRDDTMDPHIVRL